MTRNTSKYRPIEEENVRKEVLERRKDALFKKVQELCTLCDAKAAVIIQDTQQQEEYVWPSREEAKQRLEEFMERPNVERNLKMVTQNEFLEFKMKKMNDELSKMEETNNKVEAKNIMHDLQLGKTSLENLDFNQILALIDFGQEKMAEFEEENNYQSPPLPTHVAAEDATGVNACFPSTSQHQLGDAPQTRANADATFLKQEMIEGLEDERWFLEEMFGEQNLSVAWPSATISGGNGAGPSTTVGRGSGAGPSAVAIGGSGAAPSAAVCSGDEAGPSRLKELASPWTKE